jgi:protocatechuate 3,4-dioxygenase, beta subunit
MANPPIPPRPSRILPVVHNDRESETRTPARALYPIPEIARDPYTAMPPLPALREGEADLTRIAKGRPQADGEPILITGRVLDEDLTPVRATLIEVWNCNAYGRYSHADDTGNPEAKLDPNFYGFGRLLTDRDGRYAVRTIKPPAYIARRDIGWWRPPHVHFSVVGSGLRLVTQMYFPAHPLNEKDFIYLIIPEGDRDRAIGAPIDRQRGDEAYQFDIVVRGRCQTPPDLDG